MVLFHLQRRNDSLAIDLIHDRFFSKIVAPSVNLPQYCFQGRGNVKESGGPDLQPPKNPQPPAKRVSNEASLGVVDNTIPIYITQERGLLGLVQISLSHCIHSRYTNPTMLTAPTFGGKPYKTMAIFLSDAGVWRRFTQPLMR